MAEYINISDLRTEFQEVAKQCDKNNDGILKDKEISVFEEKYFAEHGEEIDYCKVFEHPHEVIWEGLKGLWKNFSRRPMAYDYDKLNQIVAQNTEINTPKIQQNKNLFAPKSYLNLLAKCDPKIVDAAIELGKIAQKHGYKLLVSDGFRSKEIQEAGHKAKPDKCAPPGYSAHEAGLALDAWLIDSKGRQQGMDQIPEIAEYLRNNDFEWGGDWTDPKEVWHFNKMNWRDSAAEFGHLQPMLSKDFILSKFTKK